MWYSWFNTLHWGCRFNSWSEDPPVFQLASCYVSSKNRQPQKKKSRNQKISYIWPELTSSSTGAYLPMHLYGQTIYASDETVPGFWHVLLCEHFSIWRAPDRVCDEIFCHLCSSQEFVKIPEFTQVFFLCNCCPVLFISIWIRADDAYLVVGEIDTLVRSYCLILNCERIPFDIQYPLKMYPFDITSTKTFIGDPLCVEFHYTLWNTFMSFANRHGMALSSNETKGKVCLSSVRNFDNRHDERGAWPTDDHAKAIIDCPAKVQVLRRFAHKITFIRSFIVSTKQWDLFSKRWGKRRRIGPVKTRCLIRTLRYVTRICQCYVSPDLFCQDLQHSPSSAS